MKNVSTSLVMAVAIGVFAGAATVAPSTARQESLRAERTVPFRMSGSHTIGAQVGPVKVSSVRFSDRGHPLTLPLVGPRASELSTTLRASFDVENPKAEDWQVKFSLEFLDREGKIIDRGDKSGNFEAEAKTQDVDHVLLSYVVPFIDRVRIRLEAKLD